MDIKKDIEMFITLIDSGKYYEAHEVMEDCWRKLKKDSNKLANFAKALTNAAISFEHINRNKPNAFLKAKKSFAGYLKYKDEFNLLDNQFEAVCILIEEKSAEMNLL